MSYRASVGFQPGLWFLAAGAWTSLEFAELEAQVFGGRTCCGLKVMPGLLACAGRAYFQRKTND
jgi:hypothetical protein